MRIKFIYKIFLFSVFPIGSLYGVFLLENGTADPFYQRFTTPKQDALILGNSKAAQGIMPSILNKELESIYGTKIYNYSFTVYNSPFGPVYLESIKNKLSGNGKKGYFIVTIDPWSISSYISDPNNADKFEENNRFLASISEIDKNPNLDYLINWFQKSYYEILLMRLKNNQSLLHPDGWFLTGEEVTPEVLEDQRNQMVHFYSDYLKKYSFSEKRFEYLKLTIEFLQTHGNVFLVRMPLHQEILNIENEVDKKFDSRMKELALQYSISYIDFNNEKLKWEFKDGLHLKKHSAETFSQILAKAILESQNN